MAQTDDYDSHDDPTWFRDQLRQRDHNATRKKLGEFEMEPTDLDLETTLGDEDWKLVADLNKLATAPG